MSTLDYILGDPMQKKAEIDAVTTKQKEAKERKELEDKQRNKMQKEQEMNAMRKEAVRARNAKKSTMGAISTLMFMQFAV